jgi:hypothetical protein
MKIAVARVLFIQFRQSAGVPADSAAQRAASDGQIVLPAPRSDSNAKITCSMLTSRLARLGHSLRLDSLYFAPLPVRWLLRLIRTLPCGHAGCRALRRFASSDERRGAIAARRHGTARISWSPQRIRGLYEFGECRSNGARHSPPDDHFILPIRGASGASQGVAAGQLGSTSDYRATFSRPSPAYSHYT